MTPTCRLLLPDLRHPPAPLTPTRGRCQKTTIANNAGGSQRRPCQHPSAAASLLRGLFALTALLLESRRRGSRFLSSAGCWGASHRLVMLPGACRSHVGSTGIGAGPGAGCARFAGCCIWVSLIDWMCKCVIPGERGTPIHKRDRLRTGWARTARSISRGKTLPSTPRSRFSELSPAPGLQNWAENEQLGISFPRQGQL